MWFDTHAHVDSREFSQDQSEVIGRAREAGVTRFVNIGYNHESIQRTLKLLDTYDWIYGAVGLHPHDAKDLSDELMEEIKGSAAHPKVMAIGETGLDFHYDFSPREIQRLAFRRQIRLAKELAMPVTIHDREAHRECLDILTEEEGWRNGGIFHCYSGSAEMAEEIIHKGFYISFSGVLTFPNAAKLKKVAAVVPEDRILIETDSPYLSPQPHRGKRNEPAFVVETGKVLAEIRGLSHEEMAKITWDNACRVYHIADSK